jgi:hypothetical protein
MVLRGMYGGGAGPVGCAASVQCVLTTAVGDAPVGRCTFRRSGSYALGAIVRFFDTGHFALETHAEEIASAIRDFLAPKSATGRVRVSECYRS